MNKFRTHTCGELRITDAGKNVKLAGWVHSVRDHGGIVFIDLRDHYGITQIVINPQMDFYKTAENWRVESVISFSGKVVPRSPETINKKIATGEVELVAESMEVLGECEPLPFQVAQNDNAPENLRLKYRFIDLRREKLHNNIITRSKIISEIRRLMTEEFGFHEFQTPILTSSSPEGARDYLVPSRLHPGKFYALPQAPQQFKQLLMVSGFDKYFQIAPCFRDEDARADRSPGEFYQLDLEMSFVEQDDIFAVVEKIMFHIFSKFGNKKVDNPPFPKIPYKEALEKYGTDKPDLRNPLKMIDLTEIFKNTSFNAFANVVKNGGSVKAISVKGISDKPRKFYDDMIAFAQSVGAKGLAYIIIENDQEKSPIVKFLSKDEISAIKKEAELQNGDAIFFIADKKEKTLEIGAAVRTELADKLSLISNDAFKFCWIVDFPMYELDKETGKITFSHNPFSMPQGGMDALMNKNPLDILAWQYDIVCNGVEL
ncbi:MAG TPA: aspartate--tRNA ligase, partial [Victivallales bacterium]|nr:aspartate--tRNA ligase [Victivallales bacterium]